MHMLGIISSCTGPNIPKYAPPPPDEGVHYMYTVYTAKTLFNRKTDNNHFVGLYGIICLPPYKSKFPNGGVYSTGKRNVSAKSFF